LANLPAWIQLASLASFSPPGLATLDALVDSTIHYETHTWDTSAYSPKYSRQRHHWFMAAPCAEPWTVEITRDWMDKTPTSTHDLSVWPSSSLGRWHPRSSVRLVLTRHSSPILNERWTRVINLSMFFLLCYDLTTILRSRALHRVLSLAIQDAWRSYMLSRLYRKVETYRSYLLTYRHTPNHQEQTTFKKESLQFITSPTRIFQFLLSQSSQPLWNMCTRFWD
jgi:hypothetical protein